MTRKALEERAKRIVEYYLRVNKDKKKVVDHFTEEGVCKKTITKVIRRHEEEGDVSFKKITGRKGHICTPEMFDKVAGLFKNNPHLPSGQAARELGVGRTTIFRILAKMREKNIETYKYMGETRCPTCHQKCDPKVLIKKERKPKRKKTKDEEDVEKQNTGNDGDGANKGDLEKHEKATTNVARPARTGLESENGRTSSSQTSG